MTNLFSKRNIIILVVLFLIIPLIIFISSTSKKDLSNKRYEEILQAVAASPGSAEIKKGGEDITDEFFDEYETSIENGDYTEAVNFLKENKASISIRINGNNEFLIEGRFSKYI
jgi:uncharacterized membrane protein